MNLEVRIESNNVFTEFRCWVCGRVSDPADVASMLYVNGEKLGNVCHACFIGGSEEIHKELLAVAAELRETSETIAEDMREEAAELEEMAAWDISCPSRQEWESLLRRTESSTEGMTP